VGRHGHQGVRLQQRRPPRYLRDRHALRYERDDRSRAREAEVFHEMARVVPRQRQHQHLGQFVLPQGGPRPVPRGLR
jgi:hypothetical protein